MMKKINYILLILGIIFIGGGILFTFLLQEKYKAEPSPSPDDDSSTNYICRKDTIIHEGVIENTELTSNYQLSESYYFEVVKDQITSANHSLLYSFLTQEDYDHFIASLSDEDLWFTGEEDLVFTVRDENITPNRETNSNTFTENYLTQLEEDGYHCQLSENVE